MDRRTYTFIVASAAFFFFYLSLRALFVPQQPPPENEVAELAEGAETEAADPLADDESAEVSPGEVAEDAGDADPVEEGITSTKAPITWYTIGSMDPADGYNFLITLKNQGAGIERIELTSRDDGQLSYRRVDTRSGYLGYFAGETASKVDGLLVNVVGPGTPADAAVAKTGQNGIKVGDIIVAAAGSPVSNPEELRQALAKTKPGQKITVEVVRGALQPATPILFEATLTEHPLDLVRLAQYGGDDQIAGNLSRLSCLMTLARVNQKGILAGQRSISSLDLPEDMNWTADVKSDDDGRQTISFETTIGSKAMEEVGGEAVRLTRSFAIQKGSYLVDLQFAIANLGTSPQKLAYRLEGANGITAEGWWYSNKITPNWSGGAARDIVYRTEAEGHELISGAGLLKHTRKNPKDVNQGIFAEDATGAAQAMNYIGVDAQYFAVAYLPKENETSMTSFSRASAGIVANEKEIERYKERATNVTFYLDSVPVEVQAGEALTSSLRMFAGPKEPELLAQHGMDSFICYGWFGFAAKPLSGLLHNLHWLVGMYGLAVILLTVIVRGCMFPLSRNAAVSAQKMQELAPEMKKIAEKYKDDMEGRLKAQQALQKRVGFNPLAGCLPMFLQLPIFMGLYRALSVDIELRQEPLWTPNGWASNLAGPDQWMYWGDWMIDFLAGRGNGYLGPYLNILPVFVVVLFITQQKLFMPPATDEQTAMTQKMMTFMTLFMGLFFFRVPAGLCIYFVASSLWGIGERLIVKRTLPRGKFFDLEDGGDVIDAVATPKETAADGKQSLAERLIQQVNPKEPEKPAERPGKRKRPPGKKKKR